MLCLSILALSRIRRYDLGRQIPHFWGGSVITSSDRSHTYDQSRFFQPKSSIRPESHLPIRVGHITEVTHTTGIASTDRSRVFQLESRLPTGVRSSDRSWTYDQSRAYNWSLVFRPESGIRSESRDTCIISMYNGQYKIWKIIHHSEYN
jgi:hypothetical protein